MTHWFTADPHFNHRRIIELCNRPFADEYHMNDTLIKNINHKVGTRDTLYILGDFGWGEASNLKALRDLIRCDNIIFIWGNHDKALRSNMRITNSMFKSTHEMLETNINGQDIVMFHNPILEWNKYWYGAWHLCGHVHGNRRHPPGELACDVGVDCHNYEPVSFEDLQVIMRERGKKE